MKQAAKYLIAFVLGGLLVYFATKQFSNSKTDESAHVIAYELKKLNKMVAVEQNFAEFYTHKSSNYIPGLEDFFSFDKRVILAVNARLQASYNLNDLEVELDSAKRVIKIKKVPLLKTEVFPNIQFYDLEQSSLNTFNKTELNGIKKRAEEHLLKKINQDSIKKQAHLQLIDNLKNIYLLAGQYNWEIEDNTKYAKELKLLVD